MQTGKVIELIRVKSSSMGNPRYIMVIQSDNGEVESVYTKPNSSHGYSASNYLNKVVQYTTCIYRNTLSLDTINNK